MGSSMTSMYKVDITVTRCRRLQWEVMRRLSSVVAPDKSQRQIDVTRLSIDRRSERYKIAWVLSRSQEDVGVVLASLLIWIVIPQVIRLIRDSGTPNIKLCFLFHRRNRVPAKPMSERKLPDTQDDALQIEEARGFKESQVGRPEGLKSVTLLHQVATPDLERKQISATSYIPNRNDISHVVQILIRAQALGSCSFPYLHGEGPRAKWTGDPRVFLFRSSIGSTVQVHLPKRRDLRSQQNALGPQQFKYHDCLDIRCVWRVPRHVMALMPIPSRVSNTTRAGNYSFSPSNHSLSLHQPS
jgi:hypothetical protein